MAIEGKVRTQSKKLGMSPDKLDDPSRDRFDPIAGTPIGVPGVPVSPAKVAPPSLGTVPDKPNPTIITGGK